VRVCSNSAALRIVSRSPDAAHRMQNLLLTCLPYSSAQEDGICASCPDAQAVEDQRQISGLKMQAAQQATALTQQNTEVRHVAPAPCWMLAPRST
jgi:hypothetical protein